VKNLYFSHTLLVPHLELSFIKCIKW